MAKNLLIALLFLIATGEGVYIALNAPRETIDTSQAKREVKEAQAQRDSLETLLKASRDSVDLVLTIAMNFKIDSRKAEIAAQQAQKQNEHDKANFTSYPTDSVRLWELARFVPSVLSYRLNNLEAQNRGIMR